MISKIFGAIFVLSLVGIALVLFQAGATSAGVVVFSDDYRPAPTGRTVTFTDPASLKVFQAGLQPGRLDYYSFQGAKDTVVQAKLDTLRLVGQDNFGPSLALFGPGLPPATLDELQLFPFSLPAGNGLLVSAESAPISPTNSVARLPDRFDEPWTQAGYWERQGLLTQLPQDGTYFLVVYSLTQQSGKYALFVGDQPQAGLRETLTFPVTWARVHYWFEDLWWPSFAIAVVGLGLLFVLVSFAIRMWWRYGYPRAYAARKERLALLLKGKDRHPWETRRINQRSSRRKLSSNKIISRLLDQTVEFDYSGRTPINSLELPSPDRNMAGLLPVATVAPPALTERPAYNNEAEPEKTSLPVSPTSSTSTLDGAEPEPQIEPDTPTGEDGLSEWGKRLRP